MLNSVNGTSSSSLLLRRFEFKNLLAYHKFKNKEGNDSITHKPSYSLMYTYTYNVLPLSVKKLNIILQYGQQIKSIKWKRSQQWYKAEKAALAPIIFLQINNFLATKLSPFNNADNVTISVGFWFNQKFSRKKRINSRNLGQPV